MALPSVDLHRWTKETLDAISAECDRVYFDLSFSCMAPEGRAAVTPYVGGNHANMSLASLWSCFQCVLIGFGVMFGFVS